MRDLVRKMLHSCGPAHRALSRQRGSRIHDPEFAVTGAVKLGSDYGGWTVVPRLLCADSIVYSVGIGSDISFDRAMIERFGCRIDAFDPTPMACDWIARQVLPPQFRFHAIGLADKDETVGFALPLQEGWDSFSLPAQGSTEELVQCPVRRLETLMGDLGHDRIDLLKMDIEGFEYGVIDDILAGPIRPVQWQIEFHHAMMHFTADQTRRAVDQLRAAGYRLFDVSNVGQEYAFVLQSALG